MDLHNPAEAAFSPQGVVLDELSCDRYLADFVRCNVPEFTASKALVCATDGGGMKLTRRMADELGTGFMMADRFRPKAGGKGEIKIISDAHIEQIERIIIVDDMVDTCGKLAEVCFAVQEFAPGAKIYGLATHGYWSGEAHLQIKRLAEKGALEWIAVTNSIDQTSFEQKLEAHGVGDRLMVVDVSRLIAGAIIRIHLGASVNLKKFRRIGPAADDAVLQEAALVPSFEYVLVAGGQQNGGFPCLAGHGGADSASPAPDEASRMQLKRRVSDWNV